MQEPTKKLRKSIEEYLKNKASNTQKNYRASLKAFLEVVKFSDVCQYIEHIHTIKNGGDVYLNDLISFVDERKKVCSSGGVVYNQLQMVIKFFRYNEMIMPKPFIEELNETIKAHYGNTDEKITDEKPFTKEELCKVVNYSPYELKPVIYLLISTGARPSEVMTLKKSNLNLDVSPVRVKIETMTTKKKYSRIAFLTPEAEECIRVWLNNDRARYVHSIRNKAHGFTDDDRILPYSYESMRTKFNTVLSSLGMRTIDPTTHRGTKTPHLTRKYTRSNMGKNGGSNADIRTRIIIGHDVDKNDKTYFKDNLDEMGQWFKDSAASALTLKETIEVIKTTTTPEIQMIINQLMDRVNYLETINKMRADNPQKISATA